MTYKAFMSYSHFADKTLAPALQSALEKFTKPWNRLRALTIFRDQTDLGVNPALWPSVLKALTESEFFILVASPASRESKWVAREIEYWTSNREVDKFLIVLTDGSIEWDHLSGDFDWAATSALPELLKGCFHEEPKWSDLRWAKEATSLSLSNERFQNAVAEVASRLHNKPPRELVGEDLRQHRRALRLARGAAGILTVLLFIALFASVLFVHQRGIAQEQTRNAITQRNAAEAAREVALNERNTALARGLAARSKLMHGNEATLLPLSALLAIESIRRKPSLDGDDALRWAQAFLPQSTSEWPRNGDVTAFSADGQYAASSSANGMVSLLNLADGKIAWRHNVRHPVSLMAFSSNGLIAAAGAGVSTILEAKTGSRGPEMRVPGKVTLIAFMPSGAGLAVAASDNTVRVFDVTIGVLLSTITQEQAISSMAFNPDGSLMATGTTAGTTRVNNTLTTEQIGETHQKKAVLSLAFHEAGRVFASGSFDGTMKVSAIDGQELTTVGTPAAVFAVGFSPDGRFVAMGDGEGLIRVIKVGGDELRRVSCQLRVISLAFSPDGRYLAATCADKTARVFSASGEELMRLVHNGSVSAMLFSKDSNRLVTASDDGLVRVASIERRLLLPPGTPARMALSPQARYVAVSNLTGGALVFEVATGRQVATVPDSVRVFKLNFSPDNRYLLTCGEDSIARIFDLSGGEVWTMGDGATVAPALSPDGRWVAIGSENMVWVFDFRRRLPKWKKHGLRQATSIAFSSDGRYLAVADLHDRGRVFRTADGKQISSFNNQTIIGYIAFAQHAPYFATNTGLYETAGWQQLMPFPRPDIIDSVAFSPDARYVAAGSLDHTVRIFDVPDRSEVGRITHIDQVLIVAFDESGRRLITVSGGDASVLLVSSHLVRTQDLVNDTCSLTRNMTQSEWTQYIGVEPYRATCPSLPKP